MLTLGIETSGPRGGIALCRGDVCIAESMLEEAPRRHAQTLVSQIAETLGRHKLRVADLDAVAVSIGPGSFTGLRVGVVCAKTLAYATGCRLAAVDTLEAIAANCPGDVDAVHVMADAQRGDLFVGTYRRRSHEEWIREGPLTIVSADRWLAERSPGDVLSGPGLAIHAARLPGNCRLLPPPACTPQARVIAQIGWRHAERGQIADCAGLEPFYLRQSAAEERSGPAGTKS
jgi:tRNA threonylcarbamoyladenosine biosynthesis protein TsaB